MPLVNKPNNIPIKRKLIVPEDKIAKSIEFAQGKELKKNIQANSFIINDRKKSMCINKSEMNFLKKNMTKYSSDLSILDFWSTDMKIDASKLIIRPNSIMKLPNPSSKIKKKKHIPETTYFLQAESIFNTNNMNQSLTAIIKACDDTQNETEQLKNCLESCYTNIVKSKQNYL